MWEKLVRDFPSSKMVHLNVIFEPWLGKKPNFGLNKKQIKIEFDISYLNTISGEKFSAFWENVTLQEDTTKKFTFAVTLYKNGDIIFAYKDIPIDVQEINDTEHPVKVGISDAYLTDKIVFCKYSALHGATVQI